MMTMEIEIMAKQNGNGQDNQVDALAALAKLSVQDLEQLLQSYRTRNRNKLGSQPRRELSARLKRT
jgi:hypothetical protein